jgi:hypothetical protein
MPTWGILARGDPTGMVWRVGAGAELLRPRCAPDNAARGHRVVAAVFGFGSSEKIGTPVTVYNVPTLAMPAFKSPHLQRTLFRRRETLHTASAGRKIGATYDTQLADSASLTEPLVQLVLLPAHVRLPIRR